MHAHMRLLFVLLCGLFLAAVGLVAAAPARAQQDTTAQALQITLPEAVQRALQVQPAMVSAEGNVRSARAARLASNGAFLPLLSASGGSARSGGSQVVFGGGIVPFPARTNFTLTLAASWDLFTGFRRLASRSAAVASQDAADAGLINERYQITLLTKQAFYNALADEEHGALVQEYESVHRAFEEAEARCEEIRGPYEAAVQQAQHGPVPVDR